MTRVAVCVSGYSDVICLPKYQRHMLAAFAPLWIWAPALLFVAFFARGLSIQAGNLPGARRGALNLGGAASVHALLPEDGWLVVSVVLPATQSDAAYSRGKSQLKWSVRGDMKHTAADFEDAAASLVLDLLRPTGMTKRSVAHARETSSPSM